MSPVTTVGQVFEAIQQAKAGAPDFCTNFFRWRESYRTGLNVPNCPRNSALEPRSFCGETEIFNTSITVRRV